MKRRLIGALFGVFGLLLSATSPAAPPAPPPSVRAPAPAPSAPAAPVGAIFLQVPGISGPATEAGHVHWIRVDKMQLQAPPLGNHSAGQVKWQSLDLSLREQRTDPQLCSVTGRVLNPVTVETVGKEKTLSITMKNATLSFCSPTKVSFVFESVTQEYH